jgi:hypothetical protein
MGRSTCATAPSCRPRLRAGDECRRNRSRERHEGAAELTEIVTQPVGGAWSEGGQRCCDEARL